MLTELKTSVSASRGNVNLSELFETLLDAYYHLKLVSNIKEIIVCLTDRVTWHFMSVTLLGTHNIEVVWSRTEIGPDSI